MHARRAFAVVSAQRPSKSHFLWDSGCHLPLVLGEKSHKSETGIIVRTSSYPSLHLRLYGDVLLTQMAGKLGEQGTRLSIVSAASATSTTSWRSSRLQASATRWIGVIARLRLGKLGLLVTQARWVATAS